MIVNQYITKAKELVNKFAPAYGKSIPIIAKQLVRSSIREKKFYLAAFYFFVIPVFMTLLGGPTDVVLEGDGIALFYAQTNSLNYIKVFYLSFFLGQILLVILSADQIAGEIEMKTFALLRSKPVYDSEIVVGKFLGMMFLTFLLSGPGIFIIYLIYLMAHGATYPTAYFGTLDEILAVIFVVLLLQGIIIALTLLFSTLFNKSLYAILGSMLTLFVISTFSDSVGPNEANYISINWLLDAFLPSIFYHLEPLDYVSVPGLFSFIFSLLLVIISLLVSSVLVLRNKEIP